MSENPATGDQDDVSGRWDGAWIVWRQDDNGNQFEVARRSSRADAEELAATMEARGHRQVYWVAAAG
jgi:hypothetical protein